MECRCVLLPSPVLLLPPACDKTVPGQIPEQNRRPNWIQNSRFTETSISKWRHHLTLKSRVHVSAYTCWSVQAYQALQQSCRSWYYDEKTLDQLTQLYHVGRRFLSTLTTKQVHTRKSFHLLQCQLKYAYKLPAPLTTTYSTSIHTSLSNCSSLSDIS